MTRFKSHGYAVRQHCMRHRRTKRHHVHRNVRMKHTIQKH